LGKNVPANFLELNSDFDFSQQAIISNLKLEIYRPGRDNKAPLISGFGGLKKFFFGI
jgi:hypothetical protein